MSDPHSQSAGLLADLARFPEMNPGPVLHMDQEGRILLANTAARTFFDQESLVGSSWPSLCTALTPEAWNTVRTGSERIEVELDRGERCVLFTHVRPEGDRSIFAYGADITERRAAERALAEQAAHLEEVARFPDMNPGPVIRTDLAGRILLANRAAKAVFGDGIDGGSWLAIMPNLAEEKWREILAAAQPVPFEARLQNRDFLFTHRRDHQAELVFIFGADITDQRRAERTLRQTERLATLGTLAAGVAHELNNPAAAARRAADQLGEALGARYADQLRLGAVQLSPEARALLLEIDADGRVRASQPSTLSPIERSDREADIEEWVQGHGVDQCWMLAPPLVEQGLDRAGLERLAAALGPDALAPALTWLASGPPVYSLIHEIGESAGRVSEIVNALRSYSYLGQAPEQDVDLHEGLNNTLIILRSKLKQGVAVNREYDDTMPRVPAYGSELNQVWTNLIDNAVDAMEGTGTLTIRTSSDADWAVVEVEDDGPGITEEIRDRVFDPFFTTKEPGHGTGLGLSTSHSIIVEKHSGRITVESRPGRTCFTVRLPLRKDRG